MEAVPLILSLERLGHVLRHFETVSPRVAQRLRAAGMTEEELGRAAATAGSLFAPALGDAIDVVALLSSLGPLHSAPQTDGSRTLTWVLSEAGLPEGAGTCGIASLESLSEGERSKIATEDRVGNRVRVLVRNTPLVTWTITAIVEPPQDLASALEVRTLFPGPYAPPFPGSVPPGPGRDEAEMFWAAHVLVRRTTPAALPRGTGV